MARAETKTLLALDRFARIMGAHPLHFNGVFVEAAPVTTCDQPLMQYDWQTADGVSRESIALAISDAEAKISQWLGFKPLPTFEIDERHAFVQPYAPDWFRYDMAQVVHGGTAAAVQLDYGHVVAGGIEQRTPIATDASVVYSDDDGDGYKETATVTAVTTVTDVNEIVLVLPGEGGAEEFEVRPIRVSIDPGTHTATITCRREQLVIPTLYERLDSTRAIDGSSDANFLDHADVYRSWHDPSQQVQFLWEAAGSTCGCGSATCQSCYLGAQFGCSTVRDYRLGLISGTPAVWDSTAQTYSFTPYWVARAPDKARWWYRAGYRDQSRPRPFKDMAQRWERAIATLTASSLERPFCGCKTVESITNYWREDFALLTQDHSFRTSAKLLDNPLGTTRGAVEAWRLIRTEALGGR
jgi:hypothetical protein